MKISIVGPAHPYRGGLAVIMQSMARVFQHRGDEVKIKTFTLQYPRIFFPGRNQTVQTPPPPDLYIVRCVNTMNPFNWIAVGRWIAREKPDFVLMKYWTPFMAPCFGTIARFAKKNGTTRILCQIDNVEPHERHMTDKPFNRYFLRAVDGFIYMSEQVHRELRRYTQVPALFSPHPLFENFGIVIDRTEACIRLELDPSKRYALFFGLIRDYKGLDLLLDAWKIYKREHPAEDRRLIVAGEFYAPKEKYLKQIADNGLEDDVILHDYFIPDELVRYYFSVADFFGAAVSFGHAERRDPDRLSIRPADGGDRRGRSSGDRAGRSCRLRLPSRCRRSRPGHRPYLAGRCARGIPCEHGRGEEALFVGCDVRSHYGTLPIG